MKRILTLRVFCVLVTFFASITLYAQTSVEGRIVDKKTQEPLIGATIKVENAKKSTTTNIDGHYIIKDILPGKYTIIISYVSYKAERIENVEVEAAKPSVLNVELEEASLQLAGVEVVARRLTDTELSMIKSVRSSIQVVSGVSSQQIGKTLDKDASEVVKRVSGVTIQDNRFIVVRGLNQRYNNVWLNNAATPSSETDVKAFSFDVIPSNMIDNLMIFKTASPELSAEATGGFIKIFTKNIPKENFLNIDYGVGYNEKTTFKDSYRLNGTALDVLGLGVSARNIPSNFPTNLALSSIADRDAYALKLSNNWIAKPHTALPNQKFSVALGRKWVMNNGAKLGTITSLNYTTSSSTRSNMQNYMYEHFDETTESPIYLYKYNADVYSTDIRVGVMHNWAYEAKNGTRIEFKNIANQIGVDKTANTQGWNNYRQGNFKYFSNQYSSRTTYSGQLSGVHKINEKTVAKLDWNAGFAYANRIEPNRQNWSMKENADGHYQFMLPTVGSVNELGRLYLTNHEYVSTSAVNYEQKLMLGTLTSTLKSGGYFEFKTRNYAERSICYKATNSGLYSDDEINTQNFETLFTEPYLGQNKAIVVDEQTNVANTYNANNMLGAGYLALNLPVGKFNFYGGMRAEYNRLRLNGYYNANSPVKVDQRAFNWFPSLNTSYKLTYKSLVRLAYTQTINRPEFREVSPLSYYDFTEKNSVRGNPNLKDCSIHNLDFRFEHYPTPSEFFSIAAFYKHFSNPIEMVSVGTGSSFSFENAMGATNYGLELELKKSLETLIGLKNFSLTVNGSYIYSQVQFVDAQTERSRALQGQSPFVINTSLFYQNEKMGLFSSLMYNVMGKRILVAAQLNQGQVVIPDIYEMPRHVLDFTLNKKIGKKLEMKLGIKDLLAQNFVTQQTYEYVKNGVSKSTVLNNKVYNLGRTWSVGASYKF